MPHGHRQVTPSHPHLTGHPFQFPHNSCLLLSCISQNALRVCCLWTLNVAWTLSVCQSSLSLCLCLSLRGHSGTRDVTALCVCGTCCCMPLYGLVSPLSLFLFLSQLSAQNWQLCWNFLKAVTTNLHRPALKSKSPNSPLHPFVACHRHVASTTREQRLFLLHANEWIPCIL